MNIRDGINFTSIVYNTLHSQMVTHPSKVQSFSGYFIDQLIICKIKSSATVTIYQNC